MKLLAQIMILGLSLMCQLSLHAMDDKEYIRMDDRNYLINKKAANETHQIAAQTFTSGCCIVACIYSVFTCIPSTLACWNNINNENENCCAATALISGSVVVASSTYIYRNTMLRQEKIKKIMIREGVWEDDKSK